MFAIEIDFNDGVSQPETMLVRRPQVVIGASDFAHVVIEDMKEANVELRIIRDTGRRLRCKPIGSARLIESLGLSDAIYENSALIKIQTLSFFVQAIDSDLLCREHEPPDRAGVRILQTAASSPGPQYPAVIVFGQNPMVISFSAKQSVTIGRSNQCLVRLDSPVISNSHAKMGFENGEFWIEDLGSTNGTFLDQQQIGGRTKVLPGIPLTLGREITIVGVDSEGAASRLLNSASDKIGAVPPPPKRAYPAIVCMSEGARPSRVAINTESTVKIGRNPSSDMWLGVPHVSRTHCTVSRALDSELIVKDYSTNGTFYDAGILEKGDSLAIHGEPKVLDFGAGVTVAICFNEEQERTFIDSRGSPLVFMDRKAIRATRAGKGTKSFNAAAVRAAAESNPSGAAAELVAMPQRSFKDKVAALFGNMDKRGRRFFYVVILAFIVLMAFVAALLKPVFFGRL